MAADRLTIDHATMFDNLDEAQVEFAADIGDVRRAFAVTYDALRALSGEDPLTQPVTLVRRYEQGVAVAGATALARDEDQMMVVISENDL